MGLVRGYVARPDQSLLLFYLDEGYNYHRDDGRRRFVRSFRRRGCWFGGAFFRGGSGSYVLLYGGTGYGSTAYGEIRLRSELTNRDLLNSSVDLEVDLMVNVLYVLVSNDRVLLSLIRRVRLCNELVDLRTHGAASGPIVEALYLTNDNSVLR